MPVTVLSFAKINIGLAIGPAREDGFHQLGTLYQTIGLHDRLYVTVERITHSPSAKRAPNIEIHCDHNDVPRDETNTCWRMAEQVLFALGAPGRVVIEIEKRLPIKGGLGAASSNAAATMLGLERALGKELSPLQRFKIAEKIGSDVPLFLFGGTVLGLGHGEQVYPLPELPPLHCLVVTPPVGVSTQQAFAAWDKTTKATTTKARPCDQNRKDQDRPSPISSPAHWPAGTRAKREDGEEEEAELTLESASDRISSFSQKIGCWLNSSPTGVPQKGRNRAEAQLLDLVRTGIDNDFERVVFRQYPELKEVKRALEQAGSSYASLSGSGSSVYGLFPGRKEAARAAAKLTNGDIPARLTRFLSRREYWRRMFP